MGAMGRQMRGNDTIFHRDGRPGTSIWKTAQACRGDFFGGWMPLPKLPIPARRPFSEIRQFWQFCQWRCRVEKFVLTCGFTMNVQDGRPPCPRINLSFLSQPHSTTATHCAMVTVGRDLNQLVDPPWPAIQDWIPSHDTGPQVVWPSRPPKRSLETAGNPSQRQTHSRRGACLIHLDSALVRPAPLLPENPRHRDMDRYCSRTGSCAQHSLTRLAGHSPPSSPTCLSLPLARFHHLRTKPANPFPTPVP